jgi:hypothetical protein
MNCDLFILIAGKFLIVWGKTGASIQKRGQKVSFPLGEITSGGIGVGRCSNHMKMYFYPHQPVCSMLIFLNNSPFPFSLLMQRMELI